MYQLPASCPFNPALDLVAEQEANKAKLRRNQWKCSFCQKTFTGEEFLDKHMERAHSGMALLQCLLGLGCE